MNLYRGYDQLYTYKRSQGWLVGEQHVNPKDKTVVDDDSYWRGGIYKNGICAWISRRKEEFWYLQKTREAVFKLTIEE